MLLWLALACTVAPAPALRAPGWLALRTSPAASLPETPVFDGAPLLVPMPDGLEDAHPGDRFTVWSEHGQLPATVVEHTVWPCGGGGPAVSVMARGKLPAEGPLWLTTGPPSPGVHPLRPRPDHLGNLQVRSDDRLVVAMDGEVFTDQPLAVPHQPRMGWLRADRTALVLLSRETEDAVVYRPIDLRRTGSTTWRDIVVPRCR
ncbi:MAG: hypothetical protein ACI8PZ_007357 [Myxococcota bacterium]|jgi:hypothetical protein